MAIKRYGTTILRTDSDGDSVPFKMSAETLILYKSYNNSDLIYDYISATGVDINMYANKSAEAVRDKIEKEGLSTELAETFLNSSIMSRVIFTCRLAAEPTEEGRFEILDMGMDSVPPEMLNDFSLFQELSSLLLDLKKKTSPNQQQHQPSMTKRKNFKCMGSRRS